MLLNLYVKNYILIDKLELEFSNKLNVITGETGAGKSILLDAISFCLTGKGGVEIIRAGTENCVISIIFTNTPQISAALKELGIEEDESEEIIITRQINKEGRKKVSLNNQPISQKAIETISENLVTIYGQHSFSNLFKVSSHIKILDNFISDQTPLIDLAISYKHIKELDTKIKNLKYLQEETSKEIDYLTHAAGELKEAKIEEGEEQNLADMRTNLQQNEKRAQLIKDFLDHIRHIQSSSNIASMVRQMSRSNFQDLFSEVHDNLEKAITHLDEAESILDNLTRTEETSLSLEEIEDRLFLIRGLSRKYGITPDKLKDYLTEIEIKLTKFDSSENELKQLEKEFLKSKETFLDKAKRVSQLRKEAAHTIENLVASELKELKMPGCSFKIDIKELDEHQNSEKGIDTVKFVASTNPGTPYDSIEKIASGGEMARFMLALQVALFKNSNNLPAIIFDEIDTGIGGVVADSVGLRLKKLSDYTQVIAITHQPQVASKSVHHIKVSKEHDHKITTSQAKILSKEEQIDEIARMLSGQTITDAARIAAKELIK